MWGSARGRRLTCPGDVLPWFDGVVADLEAEHLGLVAFDQGEALLDALVGWHLCTIPVTDMVR